MRMIDDDDANDDDDDDDDDDDAVDDGDDNDGVMMIMTMKMMISHPDLVMMIMRTWVVLGDAYLVFCSGHILADVTKRS